MRPCACGLFPVLGMFMKDESKDTKEDFVHTYEECFPYPNSRIRVNDGSVPAATPTYVEEGRMKIGWKRR